MKKKLSRRSFHKIGAMSLLPAGALLRNTHSVWADEAASQNPIPSESSSASYRAIRFKTDVTPPIGLMMAYCVNEKIDMPIFVSGILLDDGQTRVVWCSCDYIYICGETYLNWRGRIAEAAGCPPENVFLHEVHQHDSMRIAPEFNPPEGALDAEGRPVPLAVDPAYVEESLAAVCQAIRSQVAADAWTPIAAVKSASSRVGGLGANRRLVDQNGKCVIMRHSMCVNLEHQAWPTGVIDPMFRTVALVEPGGNIFAALHFYASHPQSAYRRKMVSGDVPGWAIAYAEKKSPNTAYIYFTGCGGNVTFGKYNPSADADAIAALGTRMGEYMLKNLERLEERRGGKIQLRRAAMTVPFNRAVIDNLKEEEAAWGSRAYLKRTLERWETATLTLMSLGSVNILSLGLSEVCVEYQLFAQSQVPENFLATAAYTNGIYKYMPPAKAFQEGGYESGESACVVTPEIEPALQNAIRDALADLIADTGWSGAPKEN